MAPHTTPHKQALREILRDHRFPILVQEWKGRRKILLLRLDNSRDRVVGYYVEPVAVGAEPEAVECSLDEVLYVRRG